jgi:hypothetical protein
MKDHDVMSRGFRLPVDNTLNYVILVVPFYHPFCLADTETFLNLLADNVDLQNPEPVSMLTSNDAIMVDRTESRAAILAAFRVDLMHHRSVWLISNDDVKCQVFWNAVNSGSGKIEVNKFCTTTFYKGVHDARLNCEHCQIFRKTGLEDEDAQLCPHTCFREDVITALSENDMCCHDEFALFLRMRFSSSTEVNIVKKTTNRLSLLVIADSSNCRNQNIDNGEAIVVFQRSQVNSIHAVIYCSNVQCKRRKLTKTLINPSDYCPHFEKVWSTPSIVDVIHETIGVAPGCAVWGLGSRCEFESDHGAVDAVATKSSALEDDEYEVSRNSSPVVQFDLKRRRFIPTDSNTCLSPIPTEPTSHTNLWAERRHLGLDVFRQADGTLLWNSSGYLVGSKDCDVDIPSEQACPACSEGIIERMQISDFKLHTAIGCVIRKRFAGVCNNIFHGMSSF